MVTQQDEQILSAVRKATPVKKRVTFFIAERSKAALAAWCKDNDVSESSAVDEMIKAVIPTRYFEGNK